MSVGVGPTDMKDVRHHQGKGRVMRRAGVATTGVVALAAGVLVPAGAAVAADSTGAGSALAEHAKPQPHSVSLQAPKSPVVSGEKFTVKGKFVGAKSKKVTVKLQTKTVTTTETKAAAKKTTKKWGTVAKAKTNKKGKYRKTLTVDASTKVKLRAVVADASRYCSSGTDCGTTKMKSTPVKVKLTPAATPAPEAAPAAPAPEAAQPSTPSTPVAPEQPATEQPVGGTPEVPVDTGTLVDCDNGDTVMGAVEAASAGDTLNITGTCNEADITIDKDLTVTGDGTIDATGLNGRILNNNPGIDLTISGDLTLTGGNPSYANYAGGVWNRGTVTLDGGTITGNTAILGGGIYNVSDGTLNLNGGSITGNTAPSSGGGIFNRGTVNLNGGTITGNQAVYFGGGIYLDPGSTLKVNGSEVTSGDIPAVSDNTATLGGENIFFPKP